MPRFYATLVPVLLPSSRQLVAMELLVAHGRVKEVSQLPYGDGSGSGNGFDNRINDKMLSDGGNLDGGVLLNGFRHARS